MSQRVRDKDWSSTPLGPRTEWPDWLRVTVRLVLDSGFPTLIGVGKELTAIYNDAYRPYLGVKHDPLGRPFLEIWSEIREKIEPLVDEVWEGRSHFFTEMGFTIERYGHPEETWFDFCFSPLRDETGAVAGLLNIGLESTERVRTRHRLIDLAEELDERVHRRTAELEEEVAERKRLEREVRDAAETERRRIGQALHDNLAQELSGIRMMARALQRQLEDGDLAGAINRAENIERALAEADEHARALAHDITPHARETQDLGAALQDLKKRTEDLHHAEVQLRVRDLPRMCEKTVTHLFRLIQEAILNAVTHGKAGRIDVQLRMEEETLRFEITDDGKGLAETRDHGLGIRIMRHRAELLGGALTVESAEKAGTRVRGYVMANETTDEQAA